jgi:class 3 adenylate cyclase
LDGDSHGECVERDGDYFGPTVDRVARLNRRAWRPNACLGSDRHWSQAFGAVQGAAPRPG